MTGSAAPDDRLREASQTPSFRGDAKHRARNLEIPRCAIAHLRSGPSDHPGMTKGGLLRFTPQRAVIVRLDQTIQYVAAPSLKLRNTGSSAFADDDGWVVARLDTVIASQRVAPTGRRQAPPDD